MTDAPTATILLVAPLAEETAAFVAILETAAQRVLWTENVDEAVQLAQTWRPDVVLVDTDVPSGLEEASRRLLSWRATLEDQFCPVAVVAPQTEGLALRLARLAVDDVIYRDGPRDEALLRLALLSRMVERYTSLTHRAREAQAALRQERSLRKRAEALDNMTIAALGAQSFDSITARLTDAIISALRADGGIVYVADEQGGTVRQVYTVGDAALPRLVDGAHIERLAPRLAQDQRPRQVMLGGEEANGEPWAIVARAVTKSDGRSALLVLGRRGETFFGSHEIRLFDQMIERATQAIKHARQGEHTLHELQAQTNTVRELHHRVRNNLQAMSALLSFQLMSRTPGPEGVKGTLRRIRGMAAIQDMTFQYPGDAIPLAVIAQQVAAQYAASRGDGQRVDVTVDVDGVTLTAERAQVMGLVLEELVSNACDHGLRGEVGVVRVRISGDENGVTLAVEDSGGRLPADFRVEALTGTGLYLAQMLLHREFRCALSATADGAMTRLAFTAPWEYVSRGATVTDAQTVPFLPPIEA